MSQLVSAMRAVATAALVGGCAWVCPATAAADPHGDALAGMLSKGYNPANCRLDPNGGGLAAYKCGQNPLPNGPESAGYILFGNAADTSGGFNGAVSTLAMTPCSSGDPTPDTWHYDNSPNTPAGAAACGTVKNGAMVIWTNDQNHMVGMVGGTDQASLYQWWKSNG
jgi:serine/threonine kinase PknH